MIWSERKLWSFCGKLLLACMLELLEKKTPKSQWGIGTTDIWVDDPVKYSKRFIIILKDKIKSLLKIWY